MPIMTSTYQLNLSTSMHLSVKLCLFITSSILYLNTIPRGVTGTTPAPTRILTEGIDRD